LEKYKNRSSIETSKSVIKPGTGNGQPAASIEGTSITFSTCHWPSFWKVCHIVLLSAAPT
jgi:hypothetical protein